MIITPSDEISSQIKQINKLVKRKGKKREYVPHITLHSSILSSRTDFIDKARDWLREQNPFIFTLRKVSSFSRPGTVYLTSDDDSEIEEISNLYYGLESLLKDETVINENGDVFVPHLTLGSYHTSKKLIKAESRFTYLFEDSIQFPILKVDVTEKVGVFRWKTIDSLMIGKNQFDNQQITPEIYRFGDNRRASVV